MKLLNILTLGLMFLMLGRLASGAGYYNSVMGASNSTTALPSSHTWTGKAGDGNFNTAGNWWGGLVPLSTNVAIFDYHYCSTHCSVTLNANVNIKGVIINSYYPGTITQPSGNTLTIGSSGWIQSGGIFVGSSGGNAITMNGPFVLSGGSFTSTSGSLTANYGWSITGASTFSANSGSITFLNAGATLAGGAITTPNTVTYNNVTIGNNGNGGFSHIDFFGTLVVSGTLTFNLATNGTLTGNMDSTGNIVFTSAPKAPSAQLRLLGSGTQNLTGAATGYIPPLVINSSGSVVFNTTGTPINGGTFTYTAGSIVWTNPNFRFESNNSSTAISPGALTFPSVGIAIANGGSLAISGVLDISGDLTSYGGGSSIYGISGSMNVQGNFNNSAKWATSGTNTVGITFNGISNQAWTESGTNNYNNTFTINNSAGVTLSTSVGTGGTAGTGTIRLVVTTGNLNMNGNNMTLGALTLNGNTITRNGGTLIVNGSTVPAGTQSLYGGTIDP